LQTFQISSLSFIVALVGRIAHKPVIIGVQSTGPYEHPAGVSHTVHMIRDVQDMQQTGWFARSLLAMESEGDLALLAKNVWGGKWMLNYLRNADVHYQIPSSRSYIYLVQHGFCPERVVYLPDGVDTSQFYPVTWRQEKEFELERILLCVASLEYSKGIDILLTAWARLMNMPVTWRKNFQPCLYLVGDGTLREELENLTITLGIQQSVQFLGTRQDVAALMQKAWGFVLPSRWEGMSKALLEAMACGLPCVATRVSGSEDVIEQGTNGLLVEPEQPELLSYALRLLMDDVHLTSKLGWQGYETVMGYYQLNATMQANLTFYRHLLSRQSFSRSEAGQKFSSSAIYSEDWQPYD
jgi:glycosyltransferase involved in cell wall biosynthesis